MNRRQSNPFWTANAGIQYAFQGEALGGPITPRLDWTYESSQIVSGTSTRYNSLLPARSVFNGRVSYDNTARDFTVSAGVTNLFDKLYWVNVFDYQGLGYPQTDAQPGGAARVVRHTEEAVLISKHLGGENLLPTLSCRRPARLNIEAIIRTPLESVTACADM